jgi:hypothetical protein
MAINFKQQVTAEYFAEAIKRSSAGVVTVTAISFQGDNVAVTLNSGNATNVGSAVVVFKGQRGSVSSTDPGFYALPGYGTVTQPVYTTGVACVITELGATGDLFPCGYATFNSIMADLGRRGMKIEHWAVPNTNGPSIITDFDAMTGGAGATLQASFEPNASWALSDRV